MKKISKLSALTLAVLLTTVSAFAGSTDGDHAAAEGSAPRSRSVSPSTRGEAAAPNAASPSHDRDPSPIRLLDPRSILGAYEVSPPSPREEFMKQEFLNASLESGTAPDYVYRPSSYDPLLETWIAAAIHRDGPSADNGLWSELCYDDTPKSLLGVTGLKDISQGYMRGVLEALNFIHEMSDRLGGDPLASFANQKRELDEAEENLKELEAQVKETQEKIDTAIASKEGFQARLEAWRDELVALQAESRRAPTPAGTLLTLTRSSPYVYGGSGPVSLEDILQQAVHYKPPSAKVKSTESVQKMCAIFSAIKDEITTISGLKNLLKALPMQLEEVRATDSNIAQACRILNSEQREFEGACLGVLEGLRNAQLYNRRLIIEHNLAHPFYRPFLWDLLINNVRQVAQNFRREDVDQYVADLKEHLDAPGRWGEERVAAYYFGWSTEHTRPVLDELRTPPASPRDGEGDAAAAPRTPTPTLPAEGHDWDDGRPDAAAESDVRPTSPVVAEERHIFAGVELPSAHHALLSAVFKDFETVGVPNSSEPSKSKAHTNQRYTYRAMAELLKARGAPTLELPTRVGGWTAALTGANVQATLAEAIRVIPEGELAEFKAAIALGVEKIKAARLQKTDGASASTDK